MNPPVRRLALHLGVTLLATTTLIASLPGAAAPAARRSGLEPSTLDAGVRPQDDLYGYVNRHWEASTPMPADKSTIGVFDALRDTSRERVKAIIDELSAKPQAPGSEAQKIADFYRAFVDEAAIDARGLAPVAPQLAAVAAARTPADLAVLAARLGAEGVGGPLVLRVDQDDKDATRYLAALYQSGLTLPDRDYYLVDTESYQKARAALLAYVTALLRESGDGAEDAARRAAAVVALETKLASAQRSRVALRDPNANYNLRKAGEWAGVAPLPWAAYLEAAGPGGGAITELNIGQPEYAAAVAALLASEPASTWQDYFRFKVLNRYATVLPQPFRTARFELFGRTLRGLQQDEPRWRQGVDAVGGGRGGALGEAVGRIYVERHFPPEAKARMVTLVGNLQKAFAAGIDELAWMSPATRAQAHRKLSTFTVKIGYPDVWRDYSALEVRADDPVGNARRSALFENARSFNHLGKPIDRTEWGMTPQTVNAYYNPSMNEIVFPAAILQPPFFDLAADDAVNYGAIGAVIGHEISHGFDDQGSQFDADGNLKNWWTPEDRAAFDALTARLVAQYDAYTPLPGRSIQGKLTLGENIGDLSGLAVAYRAYRLSLGRKKAPVINGLTGDQRFFLGWAQQWRSQYREPQLLQQLTSDPHSPGRYRAIGAPVNMDAFHQAFGTKPGDGMWKAPADRIKIW